jgi:pyruvate/2-oxoglutarate dehydrogenase complex dihydrolipoamide dehydrogenase (E3) component/uncharacterized membrane protein YdjX (TVP38/TMEM64 family)
MKDKYDVVVIGAGSAGLVACKLANGLGKKTALIEKRKIGGDCTWFGCIPSKALIKSAAIAHDITRLAEFGLDTGNGVRLNADKVMAHVRAVVQADAAEHPPESYEKEGINVIFGSPRFLDNRRIDINGRVITAKKFIICSGSHPFIPPIEGIETVEYLTNETIFDLQTLPESMIILGGGPIGAEMCCALNRLGVKITVVQRAEHILTREDRELVLPLMDSLKAEGVNFLTGCIITKLSRRDDRVFATIRDADGKESQIDAEAILISVGRRPNLQGLDLEKASVEFDDRGIKVNAHLRTTAKNIYAAGDVVPPYLFTHIAEYEAVIAATNASLPLPVKKTDYENVLWCTFTAPELARSGMTEDQAKETYGDKVRVYRWQHKDVDRAKTDLAQNGLTKIICDSKGKILGIHILGHAAAELMHEVQLAKSLNKPFSKIASVIHAYPSYSDAIRQPAKKCYIDLLQNNIFVKMLKTLTARQNRIRLILLAVVIALIVALRLSGLGDAITLQNLQRNGDKLVAFSNENYPLSVLTYILVYIAIAGFSIPGATVLTLAGGYLYNALLGAIYVNIAATTGATLAFLFARYIAGKSLQKKYSRRLTKFNTELDRNGVSYILTLRFIPLFPFFLINIFAGLTNMRLRTFIWTTSVGIFPGSFIYAFAGKQLGTIESIKDIATPGVLGAFGLLAVLALVPVVYKKVKKFKARKNAV